jgi:dihydrofolate reductase
VSVIIDITMSLDGYVTAPGADAEHGLGVDGEALHTWAFAKGGPDEEVLNAATDQTGAVVMGRTTFDVVDQVWTAEMGYGAGNAAQPPCFVVTHSPPESIRLVDRFTIVTDGLDSAIEKARAAAGDKDVVIMGGGDLGGQALVAGVVDVLSLHIAPLVLGGGTPLFADGSRVELELVDSIVTPNAAHLAYAVG